MSTRIYKIATKGKSGIEDTTLVEATTSAQALRCVARNLFDVSLAKATEVASLIKQGCGVLNAAEEEGHEPDHASVV